MSFLDISSCACNLLLMHAFQESGLAGVVADGVKERVHADECHAEAVVADGLLERFEGMVEIMNTKIANPDLVNRAGMGWSREESAGVRANRPPIRAADRRQAEQRCRVEADLRAAL